MMTIIKGKVLIRRDGLFFMIMFSEGLVINCQQLAKSHSRVWTYFNLLLWVFSFTVGGFPPPLPPQSRKIHLVLSLPTFPFTHAFTSREFSLYYFTFAENMQPIYVKAIVDSFLIDWFVFEITWTFYFWPLMVHSHIQISTCSCLPEMIRCTSITRVYVLRLISGHLISVWLRVRCVYFFLLKITTCACFCLFVC